MCIPRFIYSFAVSVVALLASVFGMHDALAQWTYRVAPEPYIRNISVFTGVPAVGSNTLIVSTLTDGMYKIVDTGNQQTSSFQKINNGIPIPEVRFHSPIDINTIYAGTDGAGLFKTTNGGANWLPLNGSGAGALGCLNVRSFNFDTTPTPRLIVGTACRNNSGFYQSLDDGLTWSRLGNATLPDDVAVSATIRDVASNTFFLASSNYGVFKSVDSGATWAAANTGITTANGILNAFNVQFSSNAPSAGVSPTNLLTYVHGGGVYRSLDTGATWLPSEAGLPPGYAALGGIQKESNAFLYIGLDKQGMYKYTTSTNSWASWGNTATDNKTQVARSLGISGTTYYIGTIDGLAKTTNGAVTVNGVVNINGGGRINAITHDSVTPFTAYVTGSSLFKLDHISGNCNAGCAPMDTGITGNTIEGVPHQDSSNPAIFYVTTSNRGIFKSTNGGASFSAINNGLPNMIGQTSRLAIDENNPQTLYLGLGNAAGVFKSTNGGALWTASNNGLDTPDKRSIVTVTQDHNNTNIVYAATNAGLYKSINGGANWALSYSATDSGGSLLPVNAIRVRTGSSSEIYIANNHTNANGSLAASSGIHKSIDGGVSWTNILPNQKASQVRVLNNGEIFAGISNSNPNPAVYRSTDGGATFQSYSVGLNGSDIRTFGVAADRTAVLSLALENGLYSHDASTPATVALSATITEAPFVMNTLYFDPQATNTTSASRAATVTNNTATTANIAGFGTNNNDEFTVQSHTCGTSLAPTASCTVNVVFRPLFTGDRSDTLAAIGPITGISIPVGGIGTGAQPAGMYSMVPGMVPAYPGLANTANLREMSFGNQAIGTSRTLSFTLRSIGSVPLNISAVAIDNAQFTLGGSCAGPFPLAVAGGGSCLMNVTYTPTSSGTLLANLSVTSDSTLGPAGRINIALTGVGENPSVDGSLIPAFGDGGRTFISSGPYGTESAESVAKQADGKTLVLSVGRNAVENGFSIPVLTRLNLDGTLDTSWGTAGYVRLPTPVPSGFSGVNEGRLFVLPSGKIIVSIDYNTPSNGNDAMVYRLLDTGVIDTTFGTAGITTLSDFGARSSLYADGRILVGGLVASSFPALNHLAFVRLTADGAPDVSFGTNGRSDVFLLDSVQLGQGFTHLSIAADGKILFSYPFGVGAARDIAIYRLTADGAQDTTWGSAGRVNVAATSREDNVRLTRFQSDGKLLILSRTLQPTGTVYEILLTRLNADGTTDTSFGVNGVVETIIGTPGSTTNLAQDMQILADGKIVVAGHRNNGALGRDIFLIRYLSNGTIDTTFGIGGIKDVTLTRQNEFVRSLFIDNDGSLLVSGNTSLTDTDRGNLIGTGYVLKVKNTVGAALVNLTVNKVGSGSVTSDVGGINCGGTCVASLAGGTVITLTATPASGSTFTGWSDPTCPGVGTCTITISAATTITANFSGGAVSLVNVLSRKTHGVAGSQNLAIEAGIAISGAVTVEPRTIGAGHSIVFQFSGPVTSVGSASAKDAASVDVGSTAVGFAGNEVIVTLTNVPNNRRATISVNNVNATGLNVSRTMGFLLGDVNNSRSVNPSDTSAVKARSGQATTTQNFQFDVNASGSINASDISAVKARSGSAL